MKLYRIVTLVEESPPYMWTEGINDDPERECECGKIIPLDAPVYELVNDCGSVEQTYGKCCIEIIE